MQLPAAVTNLVSAVASCCNMLLQKVAAELLFATLAAFILAEILERLSKISTRLVAFFVKVKAKASIFTTWQKHSNVPLC